MSDPIATIADLNEFTAPELTDILLGRDLSDLADPDKKLPISTLKNLLMPNGGISNALLANMAQATVKGRAVGAGTGEPTDLSATQLNAIISTANIPTVVVGGVFGVGGNSTLTIASGVITVTTPIHRVDTEGGASTDDLTTINGGTFGQILFLHTMASSRDVTIKNGSGNIICPADRTLANTNQMWVGFCLGTSWIELFYSAN